MFSTSKFFFSRSAAGPSFSSIAVAHVNFPFVSAYPWSAGFGTKYLDPSTAVASTGNDVTFNVSAGVIAVANSVTTPRIQAYPWSGSGFGSKYLNPSPVPSGSAQSVAFNAF
jgi:hypothetical protein